MQTLFGTNQGNQIDKIVIMGHVKTVRQLFGEMKENQLDLVYKVSVDSEGIFTATVPDPIASMLMDEKIHQRRNRMNKPGYFKSSTMDGLIKEVAEKVGVLFSKKLTAEMLVIKYCITTTCSYMKTPSGEIVPNGTYVGSDYKWLGGNVDGNSLNKHPYGFTVFAIPQIKRLYTFYDGKTKVEYFSTHNKMITTGEEPEMGPNLKWLSNVVNSIPHSDGKVEEIEYTEENALVFVNMIKSIIMVNERIKDMLDPDSIRQIGLSQPNLLGGG